MKISQFSEISAPYKAIFFDSYGVLKNFNGVIEGVNEVLVKLKKQKKVIKILTNDASRTPIQHIESFYKQGIKCLEVEEIISSGLMAKQFLQLKVEQGEVAYLGTKNSANYITEAGCEAIPANKIDLKNLQNIKAFVLLDDEGFDWNSDINIFLNAILQTNVPVIVANSDNMYPTSRINVAIATGAIGKMLEMLTDRHFLYFGKPDSQMFIYGFEQINQIQNFNKNEVLMVGDNLFTDILGGNRFGFSTALVLSGNTHDSQAENLILSSGIFPDFICDSILS